MSLTIKDLRKVRADKPPRTVIYGVPGVGKTTLASEWPNPVFIQTEDGTPGDLELISFGDIETFAGVIDAVAALYVEDHDRKTLVIDSLSALEKLVWAEVCRRNSWASIETPGYGKGYIETDLVWGELMTAITALRRERNMAIVMVAHTDVKRIEDPVVGPIDRYQLQLHKRAVDIVNKDADIIGFMNYLVSVRGDDGNIGSKKGKKGEGVGERIIYFEERPGFMSKNRYGLPTQINYKRGAGYDAIAKQLPGMDLPEQRKKEAA